MKTKNVYVYCTQWQGEWESSSNTKLAHARRNRAYDIEQGWPVSLIVKVAVPLPGGGK